jgi:hypothetical protein
VTPYSIMPGFCIAEAFQTSGFCIRVRPLFIRLVDRIFAELKPHFLHDSLVFRDPNHILDSRDALKDLMRPWADASEVCI